MPSRQPSEHQSQPQFLSCGFELGVWSQSGRCRSEHVLMRRLCPHPVLENRLSVSGVHGSIVNRRGLRRCGRSGMRPVAAANQGFHQVTSRSWFDNSDWTTLNQREMRTFDSSHISVVGVHYRPGDSSSSSSTRRGPDITTDWLKSPRVSSDSSY